MNKAFLIGNLTRDPKLAQTNSGKSVCKFSIAVNRNYTQDGENETGQKFMASAIDKWLEHCRERRFVKKEFIDIEDIK